MNYSKAQCPELGFLMNYAKKPGPSREDLNKDLYLLRSNVRHWCPECERLERDCQIAAANISLVVCTRFASFGKKLKELRKWQDEKAKAMEKLYRHKNSHYKESAA